ncbi:DNA repair helicase RAD25 [Pestalotiopsis sp. IQ-011]
MKIIALLSLGLTGADFLVAATPIDHDAAKASHQTFLKATDAKDIAVGQQWYLDQQNLTENPNSTHHERDIVGAAHYQVQCATQQTIDADDFAKAKQELMDWCNAGGVVGPLEAFGVDWGHTRVGICSNGGRQPCSGDEVDRILGEIAHYCPAPESAEVRTGLWYEPDWAKTYFVKDCSKDESLCQYGDAPCRS